MLNFQIPAIRLILGFVIPDLIFIMLCLLL
jgi:hypothetical protein